MEKIRKNHRPLILVTNDDGVMAGGIKALVEAVRSFGDVVVVAPDAAMSGMSHAITVKVPLTLTKVSEEDGLKVYKTNGTPADCVKLSINALFDDKPDFVVSGINHGTNSSVSVHYSGTVGAAREGALNGIPSIGFSLLNYNADADFSTAVKYCRMVFNYFLTEGMENGIYYNVNIPDGQSVKGIKVCRQARGTWTEEFEKRVDPRGKIYFWLTGYFVNNEPENDDTDEWALANGYVAVVPCSVDVTHYSSLERLKQREMPLFEK